MSVNLNKSQRSKAAFVAVVLGAAAIEGTVFAKQHHVPTGNDAFLHYQVDSTDELITALKNNPTLRRNYAKHFGIPENQVVDFVKRTLISYRLPVGRTVTTYGVTKSGRIYPVKAYLKKGTLVWATRSGLPVLKWACANPLTKKLPGTLLPSPPQSIAESGEGEPSRKPPLGTAPSPEVMLPADNPIADVSAPIMSAPLSSATSALVLPPSLAGDSIVTLPSIASVPIPISVSGGANISNLLPLIPILVAAGSGGTNNGGGGGGGTVTTVPEPGSIALLGLAGLPIMTGFIAARRRRANGSRV